MCESGGGIPHLSDLCPYCWPQYSIIRYQTMGGGTSHPTRLGTLAAWFFPLIWGCSDAHIVWLWPGIGIMRIRVPGHPPFRNLHLCCFIPCTSKFRCWEEQHPFIVQDGLSNLCWIVKLSAFKVSVLRDLLLEGLLYFGFTAEILGFDCWLKDLLVISFLLFSVDRSIQGFFRIASQPKKG